MVNFESFGGATAENPFQKDIEALQAAGTDVSEYITALSADKLMRLDALVNRAGYGGLAAFKYVEGSEAIGVIEEYVTTDDEERKKELGKTLENLLDQ